MMIKVAIVGAGKGGSALLDIFRENGIVKTVGIMDVDAGAPGLQAARDWGVFIARDMTELYSQAPDIVINVTGDPSVTAQVRESAPDGVEIIEGRGAKFLWGLVQRQSSARKDMETLYQNGLSLLSAKSLREVLMATLEKAMDITGMPAGSVALYKKDEMVMAASKGFRSAIDDKAHWTPRQQGLTAHILTSREPVEISDVREHALFADGAVSKEGIVSILACPLEINGSVVGILYLDDFRPRSFPETHRNLVRLFGMQAAQAIDKFKILDELYRVITDLDSATAYLRSVLDDSQDMIITTDTRGRIVEFSKGGERILGYTRDEAIGMDAADLYVDKGERTRVMATLKEKAAVFNYETQLLKRDGTPIDISLTISQLTNTSGAVIGTVGISKDITEEKRLREELARKNEELGDLNLRLEEKVLERTRQLEKINRELTRTNQIKARFISNMSHELRTPLNSILGFSEILSEKTFGDLNEKQLKHVSNIYASGKHLLQLVNNILDLAKIEAGKMDLFYEDFSVREAVEEVVMIMTFLATKKSISIDVAVTPEVNAFHADKVKFKQVLYNLVSNAIKFTPEGGRIDVSAEYVLNRHSVLPWALEGQKFLKVSVADTGIGIREEDRDRIFEEFEQADSSMARDYGGTGLGLSLTKRLVDLHGGHVEVDGRVGEGSRFSFYIPSVLLERKKVTPEEYSPVPMTYPWLKEEAPLVLVVEDDLPTSEILTIHLTKAGYRVVHAYDGVEAIAKARELRPFVITLDVMLPKKDGWEVLQSLKADHSTNNIPVIIHSIIDNKDLAFTLGASDYLLKPVDKNLLLDKLGELSLSVRKSHVPTSVLLISNDPATQDYICTVSSNNGFLFHSASGEEEGLELAVATKPQTIMLDLNTCGLEFIKRLKKNAVTAGTPVFALTNRDLSIDERMNLTGQIERILKKDSLVSDDLVMHLKDLEILHPRRAGLIDELTGLFNHRYLQLRVAQEVNRSVRYKMPLTVLLLDVDHFSHYVKAKGDYHGNLVLKKIADLLRRNVRGSDIVVRYSGDAFSIVLPNTPVEPGVMLAKRFNNLIRDYPFLDEEVQPTGKLTVSVGVATYRDHSPEELMKCCEGAVGLALRKGGNAVEVSGELG